MSQSLSIGIVGGGPAGLSLARLLRDLGYGDITVFEANTRVGGKSYTVYHGEAVVEMGTCYATYAHRVTNQWMKELGMPMSTLGEQRFDDADFVAYFRAGDGPPLATQMLQYWRAKARLEKALSRPSIPDWAIQEASLPVETWLRKRNLGKIERFMHRSLTGIAYGFVDETSTVQALRWNDMDLIITGVFKQLKMPIDGWGEFWRRLAKDFDVRTGARVTAVDRTGERPVIQTADTQTEFDVIVCAIPVDEFAQLTTPTDHEAAVAESIDWNSYTTTLLAAENWFRDWHVEAYRDPVLPGAERGQLLSARRDGFEPELGGDLYLTGQLSGDYTNAELIELLRRDIAARGAQVTNVILQTRWKYFARYKLDAIRSGLLSTLRDMQGDQRTWYTGATFSHEAVSHIVNFNVGLARRMRQALQRAGGRSR